MGIFILDKKAVLWIIYWEEDFSLVLYLYIIFRSLSLKYFKELICLKEWLCGLRDFFFLFFNIKL